MDCKTAQILLEFAGPRRNELAAEDAHAGLPAAKPADADIKALLYAALCKEKGNGYCGRLLSVCPAATLPKTIRDFLLGIYLAHPAPTKVPPIDEAPAGAPAEGAVPVEPEAPAAPGEAKPDGP